MSLPLRPPHPPASLALNVFLALSLAPIPLSLLALSSLSPLVSLSLSLPRRRMCLTCVVRVCYVCHDDRAVVIPQNLLDKGVVKDCYEGQI